MTEAGKLFVVGLNFNTDKQSPEEIFSKYGQISEMKVIKDKDITASRSFSFITFKNPEDARDVLQAMNTNSLDGRQIQVGHAKKRPGGSGGNGPGSDSGGYGNIGCRRAAQGGYWNCGTRGSYSGGGRFGTGDQDSKLGGYKGEGGYYYGGGDGYGGRSYWDYDKARETFLPDSGSISRLYLKWLLEPQEAVSDDIWFACHVKMLEKRF